MRFCVCVSSSDDSCTGTKLRIPKFSRKTCTGSTKLIKTTDILELHQLSCRRQLRQVLRFVSIERCLRDTENASKSPRQERVPIETQHELMPPMPCAWNTAILYLCPLDRSMPSAAVEQAAPESEQQTRLSVVTGQTHASRGASRLMQLSETIASSQNKSLTWDHAAPNREKLSSGWHLDPSNASKQLASCRLAFSRHTTGVAIPAASMLAWLEPKCCPYHSMFIAHLLSTIVRNESIGNKYPSILLETVLWNL